VRIKMRYLGGKSRIAKQLCSYINDQLKPDQPYVEPFCGACWIISNISNNRIRIANDVHKDLMLLWQDLQKGWIPPEIIDEELYNSLKTAESSALRGFVGFGASFGAKWFGGYARDRSSDRNYSREAKYSLLKKLKKMSDVLFINNSYENIQYPAQSLIYCDPPYENTTKYSTHDFDYIQFWEWVRVMTKMGHVVLVSEYSAPQDFTCVLEIKTKTDMGGIDKKKIDRIERLFAF
jgi:DNA adenine methylase